MNIAVIGSGIAGLTAAYLLSRRHAVTVFEAAEGIGGHTATVDVQLGGQRYAIDTGFIVYNDRTYPNFIRLLQELGVESQPTTMGFSVKEEATGFEYAGGSWAGLFARRRNLVDPRFWRMLADILRFNREAPADLDAGLPAAATLGDYLRLRGYGDWFARRYLVPMGAAIWSSSTADMAAFPLRFFLRFFRNHGLLELTDRPQWRVVRGGSRSYLGPLIAPLAGRIHCAAPVRRIQRGSEGVTVDVERLGPQLFDQVVIATHSDQALAMLADASAAERAVLGAIPYRDNDVVLHTDERVLPRRRSAWSSWNYRLGAADAPPALTYDMNILQGIAAPVTFCVSLNQTDAIAPVSILQRFRYAHPVFTVAGIAAQARWAEIAGRNRTWYCGAYWRNGFHEDGVASALRVCAGLGVEPW